MKKSLSRIALIIAIVLSLLAGESLTVLAFDKVPPGTVPLTAELGPEYKAPFNDGIKFFGRAEINGLPALGWNSWNAFQSGINEDMIKDIGNSFIRLGLDKVGYEYVVIDDGCYHGDNNSTLRGQRDADGKIQSHPVRFPSGFKALADHMHSLGIKFGMYEDAGQWTCNGRHVGTWGTEDLDAQTFADWGIDYLKYDYCNHPWYYPMNHAAPVIRSIRIAGNGFNQSLNAIEDGTVTGYARRYPAENFVLGIYGATQRVGDGELLFTVNAPSAGNYTLELEYAALENGQLNQTTHITYGRWAQVDVNGSRMIDERLDPTVLGATSFNLSNPSTILFSYSPARQVTLKAGENLIRIYCQKRKEIALYSYASFADAIAKTGRDIKLSICEWGYGHPWLWGYKVGDSWRTTGDITGGIHTASWGTIFGCYEMSVGLDAYAGLERGWNDADMLCVGLTNTSVTPRAPFTYNEDECHFNAWAIMNSPLMLGNDLRNVNVGDQVWKVITNRDVLALNQDPLGIQAKRIKVGDRTDSEYMRSWINNSGTSSNIAHADVLAKPLANGDVAIMMLNPDSAARTIDISIDEILKGLEDKKMVNREAFGAAATYYVKDLRTKAISTLARDGKITENLVSHSSKTYRISTTFAATVNATSTIVEGYNANIKVTMDAALSNGAKAVVMLDDKIIGSGDFVNGAAAVNVSKSDIAVGRYLDVIAVAGDVILGRNEVAVLRLPANVWKPTVSAGNPVTVTFAEDITLSDAKLTLNGVEYAIANTAANGRVLTLPITSSNLATGSNSIVLAGIKYERFFPDYSFTFKITQ